MRGKPGKKCRVFCSLPWVPGIGREPGADPRQQGKKRNMPPRIKMITVQIPQPSQRPRGQFEPSNALWDNFTYCVHSYVLCGMPATREGGHQLLTTALPRPMGLQGVGMNSARMIPTKCACPRGRDSRETTGGLPPTVAHVASTCLPVSCRRQRLDWPGPRALALESDAPAWNPHGNRLVPVLLNSLMLAMPKKKAAGPGSGQGDVQCYCPGGCAPMSATRSS